ncbi:Fe-S cluster assembly protein SufD [Pollutimonas thiosulfatoxidans]|uniref:Fe-S cluster assembly protein SufD n=1 Tax=Pollutimonas thiosulfatoxidans TaxID=2028345 RepID=A0A410GAH4_9BURK|nr:Fe-S cluster assembly protein SufD [Pollutimonas thiosulfatoxidans]NYT44823.1 Fe-S cluster assembly protein SufD [Alcaligenaceae bacterium]QAA93308.1 Fe-S cluster assembly protein SufD [Pollutimonas thiosulfatoxidans]
MTVLQSWVNDFSAREQALAGAGMPWLAAMRKRAIQRFADEGWPTTRQEAWRHTSLAALGSQQFASDSTAAEQGVADLVQQLRRDEPGHWLVFIDGRYAAGLSDVGSLPAGATITTLAQAFDDAPDRVQELFGIETDGSSTATLNVAFAHDGAYINLARGVALEAPVHLVFVAATPGIANFPRNLIAAEAGAVATIVEHYVGHDSGASLTNTVTRLSLAQDANITQLKLQQEDHQAFHLGVTDVLQQKGSAFNSHSMSFGARLARHDISTRFDGDHCETLLNGLYYVDGKRHVDHHTLIDHAQPHGSSREFYRGILNDTARGVFSGRILVGVGADKTDAVQRSDSLLLSRMAKADARPELEIYADDVKCAHGATVGQLDDNSLFYLRSRGLDEAHARHVLTYAFAAEAVGRIQPDILRRRVIDAIRSLVPGGAELGEYA